MIQWRSLLDSISVRWRDRGSNTSRGHVNIACCWCRDDPSAHLAINEETGEYYCYRAPQRHAGRSPHYLLAALGVAPAAIDGLLRIYSDGEAPRRIERAILEPAHWARFEAAYNSEEALAYLSRRNFANPQAAAALYDLRVSQKGTYAGRLLLPLANAANEVIGFTARSMREHLEPKYLTYDPAFGSLYLPQLPAENTKILLLVEGPFDALSAANAFPNRDVVCAAILGLAMPAARLLRIVQLASTVDRVCVALDQDQPVSNVYQLIDQLASSPKIRYVVRCPLPQGFKDPGEMLPGEIVAWISRFLSQAGQASSKTGRGATLVKTSGE